MSFENRNAQLERPSPSSGIWQPCNVRFNDRPLIHSKSPYRFYFSLSVSVSHSLSLLLFLLFSLVKKIEAKNRNLRASRGNRTRSSRAHIVYSARRNNTSTNSQYIPSPLAAASSISPREKRPLSGRIYSPK